MKNFKRLFKVWVRYIAASMQVSFASRLGAGLFIIAKLLRFGFFLFLILTVLSNTNGIGTYNQRGILMVFLTFTLIDTLSQLLFREVYRFRPRIVSGDFDLDLLKPLPSLFRPLLGGADLLDAITLIPYFIVLVRVGSLHDPSLLQVFLFTLLMGVALLIAATFHILVLALGVMTTQIDHAIMIYRDVTSMGRFPVDIYPQAFRLILTIVVPIGVMVTLPAQVIIGVFSPLSVVVSMLFSLALFTCGVVVWNKALAMYTSASS